MNLVADYNLFKKKSITYLSSNLKTLLIFLLVIDLLFVLLHFYTWTLPAIEGDVKLMRLDMDMGYAETFQYAKYLTIAGILIFLFIRNKKYVYLTWAFFHVILFFDDAFQMHEKGGGWLADYFSLPSALGMRARDFGEIAIVAMLGLIFVIPVLISMFSADKSTRKISFSYIQLVGILIFFGVGIDMLHSFLNFLPGSGIFAVVEDAGEMFATSLLVIFTFWLYRKKY